VVSRGVPIALELRGIRKRFVVGLGACRAAADVLRGVDLVVRRGDCAIISGAGGAGKTALLLCAASLVTPDAGERTWFGESSRVVAGRRVLYHRSMADLLRAGRVDEPNVHLVDIAACPDAAGLEEWIEQRRARGDAIVVATRDAIVTPRGGFRAYTLYGGQLQPAPDAVPSRSRVAERAHP
jgi:energy-coupling factor transporter ATP-binding protein EcfA2